MKITDGFYDPEFKEYLDRIVEERKKRIPKIPPSTVQPASTQAILDRPVEDDLKHWLRPIPKNWCANPEAWKILQDDPLNLEAQKAFVGAKDFDPTQVAIVEDIRGKARNTEGQSEKSSVTPERKEKAIHAFHYSQPAPLTPEEIKKVTVVNEIKEFKIIKEEEPEVKGRKYSLGWLLFFLMILITLICTWFFWPADINGREYQRIINKDQM